MGSALAEATGKTLERKQLIANANRKNNKVLDIITLSFFNIDYPTLDMYIV